LVSPSLVERRGSGLAAETPRLATTTPRKKIDGILLTGLSNSNRKKPKGEEFGEKTGRRELLIISHNPTKATARLLHAGHLTRR
jgi:hypothetical protein